VGDGGREPASAAGFRAGAFALLLPLLVGLAEVAGVGLKRNVEGPGQRPQRDGRGRGELPLEKGGRWRLGALLADVVHLLCVLGVLGCTHPQKVERRACVALPSTEAAASRPWGVGRTRHPAHLLRRFNPVVVLLSG
jgi:hypothetical protein